MLRKLISTIAFETNSVNRRSVTPLSESLQFLIINVITKFLKICLTSDTCVFTPHRKLCKQTIGLSDLLTPRCDVVKRF